MSICAWVGKGLGTDLRKEWRFAAVAAIAALALTGCDDGGSGGSGSGADVAGGADSANDADQSTDSGANSASGPGCVVEFTWLQKDAYRETAGRSVDAWPPHTTTTLYALCEVEGSDELDVRADAYMANHGTAPGATDAAGDVFLVNVGWLLVEDVTPAQVDALVSAFEACECDAQTQFLSMDSLQDQAIEAIVAELVQYVSINLACDAEHPTQQVIESMQQGDIEAVLDALPFCAWDDGHDWSTGFSDAALVLLDEVQTTLLDFHVCNNDAALQAQLMQTFAATGEVVACDPNQDLCRGPKWLYTVEAGSTSDAPGE